MTRVKKKKFFEMHDIKLTKVNELLYEAGWTLTEIKKGEEYIEKGYRKEVIEFKKTLI